MDELKRLQALVLRFAEDRDWGQFHSPRNLAMCLSVEASELLELYLWSRDDGPQPATRRDEVADEAADVLICLLNFASRAEIDLSAALESKLARAAQKYPAERVRGRSLKYDEYAEWADQKAAAATPEAAPKP